MKRIISAALASMILAGSITATASAQAYRPGYTRDYQRHDRYDRHDNHHWKRGDRIDHRYHYAEVDYRAHHLRPPQRGYHYVRDDSGNILLAAIATGLIASVIANQ